MPGDAQVGRDKRIRGLDGLRGLAILMVLLWHYPAGQIDAEPPQLLGYFMVPLGGMWSGVDLFFVLSGFLITGILLDNKGAPNFFKVFYIRRSCRILPLYFALLLPLILVKQVPLHGVREALPWLFENPMSTGSYLTFTQNIAMGLAGKFGAHWAGVTWSLAVEEQFYLLLPLLVYWLSFRRFTAVCVAFLFIPIFLRGLFPGFHAFINIPFRADSLLAGSLVAILFRSDSLLPILRERIRFVRLTAILLGLGFCLLTFLPKIFGQFNHSWLALFYATLVLLVVIDREGPLDRWLDWSFLRYFGMISYALYLFHQPVSGILHGLIRGREPEIRNWSDAGITALAFVVSVVLSHLSWHLFERRFLALGRRFKYFGSRSEELSAYPGGAPDVPPAPAAGKV